MDGFEQIATAHPRTGAFRVLTPELLAETYLTPKPAEFDWVENLQDEAYPWNASMQVAPVETGQAVADALRTLAQATSTLTPEEIDLSNLDQSTRIFKHVEALRELWRRAPAALPRDFQIFAHILNCSAQDALEVLPLTDENACAFASPIARQVHQRLLDHHGLADTACRETWAKRRGDLVQGASEPSSLSRVQRGLIGGPATAGELDSSLSFYAVRDVAEEAQLAAGIAQRHIDAGAAASDIALLIPDEAEYFGHLAQAFRSLGIPISGLPELPGKRDIAGETLLHLLVCLQKPAPAMALASLYISPLMPWAPDIGRQLAREVMEGRYEPYLAKALSGRSKQFYQLLRGPVAQTPSGILGALEKIAQLLSKADEFKADISAFRSKLSPVRSALVGARSIDWPTLYSLAAPATPTPEASERFVEGVSIFTETALPWRSARHLIAMGMSGYRWPRAVTASPLFLDGEIKLLRAKTGLQVETRGDVMARRMERIRRQLLSARESLSVIRPVFSSDGIRQPCSPAVALMARTISKNTKVVEDANTLFHDLRSTPPAQWPCEHEQASPRTPAPPLPRGGVIKLERDLLLHRATKDDHMRPQSPSRLETLLVSPLAWCLSEFSAEPILWAPDSLNIMLAGTLAHEVLEHLFEKESPLPAPNQIEVQVPELLAQAIRRHAPFMQRAIWSVERLGLERDILKAAIVWRDTMDKLGASVVDNEILLHGEGLGIRLRGRADCLLQLPDGSLLIVDHKKSGTRARRDRLDAGWDLQLGLYRSMLQSPEELTPSLEEALKGNPKIGVAYHLINDHGVLLEGLSLPPGIVTIIDGQISALAMRTLSDRLSEVRTGKVRLNSVNDRDFFKKTAKLTPYALTASPLIERFMLEGGPAHGDAKGGE